jgi:hypothetical protein
VFLFAIRPDRSWYAARAVAESIKTATWRFVSVAEPFDNALNEDRARFRNLLKSVVDQNRDITQRLTKYLDEVQITSEMITWRNRPLEDRLNDYLEHRVKHQQTWYAKKAAWNRRMSTKFYGLLLVLNAMAVIFAVAKVRFPTATFWPTDVFITSASGVLAWLQAKRFSELASSYALAAHEISLVREQGDTIQGEREFSRFVGDAENAFSREHTQWVARKDD